MHTVAKFLWLQNEIVRLRQIFKDKSQFSFSYGYELYRFRTKGSHVQFRHPEHGTYSLSLHGGRNGIVPDGYLKAVGTTYRRQTTEFVWRGNIRNLCSYLYVGRVRSVMHSYGVLFSYPASACAD